MGYGVHNTVDFRWDPWLACRERLWMSAASLLDRLGLPDPTVTAAAERAEATVEPPNGMATLRRAIKEAVCRAVGDHWDEVYAAAVSRPVLSGFYHRNVRVGPHLVRAPLPRAERMDLSIWPEPAVLAAIRQYVPAAPVLRAVSHDPPYQVHDWIDGTVLDAEAPRGARVPESVLAQCVDLFGQLREVPRDRLPPLPGGWPDDGDCAGFAERLLAVTRGVHARFAERYATLWRSLEIPVDPFAPLALGRLRSRPFQVVHCDVHRKNIILAGRRNARVCRFLDWELALFGDPVYELAVHLHKMAYLPDEEQALCRIWEQVCRADQWPGWQEDLRTYRDHERVKSAIVDSVRYANLVADAPEQEPTRVASLVTKLTAARRVWGVDSSVDAARVAGALRAVSG